MGEIIIKGKIFTFEDVKLTYDNATTIDASIAKQNLLDFKRYLMKGILNSSLCTAHY